MTSGSPPIASAARSARLPTISEWWYVPGVSTSRRRSSGCDGFASSSSWKTVRMPKTEPRTANVPTAATPEPSAEAAEANHSSTMPWTSRAPSSENTVTTMAFTTKTANAAWTKTWSRSPLRITTMPARPPRRT